MKPQGSEILGKRIKETRLKLGLTQDGLGKRANLHYSYIGQVERGNKVPSVKTLKRIAAALNISVESLLYEESGFEIKDEDILVRELINVVKGCTPQELRMYISIIEQIKHYLQR
ncbi:helix-turn-helix domain-containing protein [Desulfotruncus alcoholivorax]|uniref:helix-turn-helix domain-containing protein n=1 Tax=Desulfotruncus alcoholivorax TaxID=265477 RepID=UPI000420C303|nr:helix-turn-helix transcriptional regulator [Desulfotruncus alcoholivorax]